MTDVLPVNVPRPPQFVFLKGAESGLGTSAASSLSWEDAASRVREQLSEALGARHVAFLFGSGCSSFLKDGRQLGIPTMGPTATSFAKTVGGSNDRHLANQRERDFLKAKFGIDISSETYERNLEALLEVLLSQQFVLRRSTDERHRDRSLPKVEAVIEKATRFILRGCTQGQFSQGDETVANLYQAFYRKLAFRDRSLPRPWIFTTNYDLFNEAAMDRLSVPYSNGFSGTVERRFNPANFRYSLGEQLDITSRKWTAAESFVYLCKLHGSVNWVEDGRGLFPIRELQEPSADAGRLMIYPTPAKQAASFGSPYSDLFREFHSRLVREQSVLFVLGYSFGDDHVNNIIYQALTVPTFRLVAFASPTAPGVVSRLRALGDPRVWIIGGDGPTPERKAHYFDTFVEYFMPEPPGNKVDKAVERVLATLLNKADTGSDKDDNGV